MPLVGVGRHVATDHLDGDVAIDRGLPRSIDDSHPALTDCVQQLIVRPRRRRLVLGTERARPDHQVRLRGRAPGGSLDGHSRLRFGRDGRRPHPGKHFHLVRRQLASVDRQARGICRHGIRILWRLLFDEGDGEVAFAERARSALVLVARLWIDRGIGPSGRLDGVFDDFKFQVIVEQVRGLLGGRRMRRVRRRVFAGLRQINHGAADAHARRGQPLNLPRAGEPSRRPMSCPRSDPDRRPTFAPYPRACRISGSAASARRRHSARRCNWDKWS